MDTLWASLIGLFVIAIAVVPARRRAVEGVAGSRVQNRKAAPCPLPPVRVRAPTMHSAHSRPRAAVAIVHA